MIRGLFDLRAFQRLTEFLSAKSQLLGSLSLTRRRSFVSLALSFVGALEQE